MGGSGDAGMTELEAVFLAFGPHPEPELDGAGRDAFAAIMAERERLGDFE